MVKTPPSILSYLLYIMYPVHIIFPIYKKLNNNIMDSDTIYLKNSVEIDAPVILQVNLLLT